MATTRTTTYRAALRFRDLRLVLGALLVDQMGGWAFSAALTIYVWDQTHSAGMVAVASLSRLLPVLVFSPYAGVLADRFERIGLMVRLDTVSFAWIAGAAVAIQAGAPLAIVLLLSAFSAITDTPFKSAVAAVLPRVAGEDQLAAANALNGTIDNLTILAGPAVGAVLVTVSSAAAAFYLDAVTYLAAAYLVSRCRIRSPGTDVTEGGTAGTLAQMRAGLDAIASNRTVLLLVVFCALDTFYAGLTKVFFVQMSVHVDTGAAGYGYLVSAFGAGGVLAAGVSNRLASSDRLAPVIAGGMAALYLPLLVQPWIHAAAVTAALQAVAGAGMLIVDVVAITALQRAVPQERLARVFGVFWAIMIGAAALGTLLAPLSLSWLGYTGALLLFGAGVTAVSLLGYPSLHRADTVARRALEALLPKITVLEGLQLFAAAPRAALERLAADAADVQLPAGAAVVTEGTAADAFYVLLEGEVRVSARGEAGTGREIRRMSAPCYFGEIGLIQRVPRTATVETTVPSTLWRIDGELFLRALNEGSPSRLLAEGVATRLAVTHPSQRSALGAGPETVAGEA